MKNITLLGLAALLTMAVACGGSKGDADKTTQQMITVMEDLGKVAKENQDDCGKMVAGMEAILQKNEALFKQAKEIKGSEEDQKKMMEKYGDKLMAAAMGMMPAMKCASDPKMAEMQKKYETVFGGK